MPGPHRAQQHDPRRRLPPPVLRDDRADAQRHLQQRNLTAMPSPDSAAEARARRERGVVLFIALIAMVVLSLAGVALIRVRRHDRLGRGQHRVPRGVGHGGQPGGRAGGRLAVRQQDAQSRTPSRRRPPLLRQAPGRRKAQRRPRGAVRHLRDDDGDAIPSARRTSIRPPTPRSARSSSASAQPRRRSPPRQLTFAQKLQYCDELAAEGVRREDVDETQRADAAAHSALPGHRARRSAGHQHVDVRAGHAALTTGRSQGRLK